MYSLEVRAAELQGKALVKMAGSEVRAKKKQATERELVRERSEKEGAEASYHSGHETKNKTRWSEAKLKHQETAEKGLKERLGKEGREKAVGMQQQAGRTAALLHERAHKAATQEQARLQLQISEGSLGNGSSLHYEVEGAAEVFPHAGEFSEPAASFDRARLRRQCDQGL